MLSFNDIFLRNKSHFDQILNTKKIDSYIQTLPFREMSHDAVTLTVRKPD